jgi:CheY-like chemotaxis protein
VNKLILYIEDDPDQLVLVRCFIERELPGVIVDVCCTASGAEAFLNSRCYDLIICDVALPGELGTDIAARILERDPTQPIYLMSEYTGPEVRAAATRIGLELQRKFSQKDPDEFIDDIRKMLAQRPCDSSIAKPPGSLGEAADTSGGNGNSAATRENSPDVIHGNSAVEISRPRTAIRLTSPHVLAARASLA